MQKKLTSLSVRLPILWTLAVAIAGCSPNEEELRARKALEEQKIADAYANYVKEEQLRKVKSTQVLVKLSEQQLYKFLDNCKHEIQKFAGGIFNGKSIGLPELITEHSSAASQAEAYISSKRSLVSDTNRIKAFRAISAADLASGAETETLDTSYPVLVREDSFAGPQPRVMKYRCDFVDSDKMQVMVG